jgi:hypothetical protein
MKVWELIAALNEMKAGAEIVVKLHNKEIEPGSKSGWVASVDEFVEADDGGDPLVIITLEQDLSEIIKQWKKGELPSA